MALLVRYLGHADIVDKSEVYLIKRVKLSSLQLKGSARRKIC